VLPHLPESIRAFALTKEAMAMRAALRRAIAPTISRRTWRRSWTRSILKQPSLQVVPAAALLSDVT
jgi:hypothetical protein